MQRTGGVFALVLALAVTGCANAPGPETTVEVVNVVAGFYPIAEAAERIGGDSVDVLNLTPPGAEPHDLEISSDSVDVILDADVVLYLGEGFQPALEETLPRAQGVVIDLLKGGDLMAGSDDHAEEEENEHAEDEGSDPHVWLDPRRWAEITQRIAAALAEADPDRTEDYEAGARNYAGDIDELHEEFSRGLDECERNLVVTSHAAFGYLAARYGLVQEAISGIAPEAEPDPRRLAELIDLVESEGVTTVYTETLVSPDVAATLAREAGVDVATLNPLEGLTEREIERGEDYVSVMRTNLRALRDGLGCEGA